MTPVSVVAPDPSKGLAAALRHLVRDVLAEQGLRPGEIAIVLADDAELRVLNRRHRGIDRATDVLSFSLEGEPRPSADHRRVSGDIVISLERVTDQARRYRVSLGAELARLVVHGALHLAGHDHHRVGERRLMKAREERALRQARARIQALDRHLSRS